MQHSRAKPPAQGRVCSELTLASSTCRSSKGPSTWEAGQKVVKSVSTLGAHLSPPHQHFSSLQLPRGPLRGFWRLAHVECSAPSLGLSERAPPCEYKRPRLLRFPSRPRTTPHFPSKNSVGEDPTCELPRLYSWPVLIFRFFFASQTSFTASSASDGAC